MKESKSLAGCLTTVLKRLKTLDYMWFNPLKTLAPISTLCFDDSAGPNNGISINSPAFWTVVFISARNACSNPFPLLELRFAFKQPIGNGKRRRGSPVPLIAATQVVSR